MNRGQVAATVAKNKEAHPENYCSVKGCLWRTTVNPCRKHPHAPKHLGRIVAGEDQELALPEIGE